MVAISKCHVELRELAWTKAGQAALIQLFREEGESGASITLMDIKGLLEEWKEKMPTGAACDLSRTPEVCTIRWSPSGTTEMFAFEKLNETFAGRVLEGMEELPGPFVSTLLWKLQRKLRWRLYWRA